MSDCYMGHEDCDFPQMVRDGDVYLMYAAKGDGKTTAAMILGSYAKMHDYLVVSNVMLMRWNTEHGKFEKIDRAAGYIYVDNFETMAWELLKFLQGRGQPDKPRRLLYIMDEVTLSLIRAGKTVLDPLVQAAIGFSAVSRKMSMATILLTQAKDLVSTKFRGIEQGLITGFLTKPSMPGYLPREVLQWELQDPDQPWVETRGKVRANLKKVPTAIGPLIGWARTPDMIKNEDGTYKQVPIFHTYAIAKFSPGVFTRGSRAGKPFDLQGMLDILAGEMPEEWPDLIERYLVGEITPQNKPKAMKEEELFEPDEKDEDADEEEDEDADEEKPETTSSEKEHSKATVVKLLLEDPNASNAEIGRIAECSREYVRQVRKELKAVGRL